MALAGFVHDELFDTNGKALGGAMVQVKIADTTTDAKLYAAATMGTELANPVQADSRGNVSFWAANGEYDIIVTPVGGTAQNPYRVRTGLAPGQASRIDDALTKTDFTHINILTAKFKHRPWVDPTHRDFNGGTSMVVDSVTDNSPGFQAADELARTSPSTPLRVPSGHYSFATTVNKHPQTVWLLPRARSVFATASVTAAIESRVNGPAVLVDGGAFPVGAYDVRGGIDGGTWRTPSLTDFPLSSAIRLLNVNDHWLHGLYAFYFHRAIDTQGGHLLDLDRVYLSRNNTSVYINDTDDVWFGIGDYAGYDYGVHCLSSSSLKFFGGRHEYSGKANIRLEDCFQVNLDPAWVDLSYNRPDVATVFPNYAAVFGSTDNPNNQYGIELIDCARVSMNGIDWFRIGATNTAVNQKAAGGNVDSRAVRIHANDTRTARNIVINGGRMWRGSAPAMANMSGVEFTTAGSGDIRYISVTGTEMVELAALFLNPQLVSRGFKVDRNSSLGNDKAQTRTSTSSVSLRIGSSPFTQVFTAELAANLNVDIYSTGWTSGDTFRIIRLGAGAGSLFIRNPTGPVTLATLSAAGTFADVMIYDNGAGVPAYRVVASGSLP